MSNPTWTSTSSTDASAAGNYLGGLPVTGDTLELNSFGTANLETGLGYYTNVMGLTINALAPFAAGVGLEASGTNDATYLAPGTSGTSNVFVGRDGGNGGNGASIFLLKANGGTLNVHVFKTGSRAGTYPVLCLKGASINLYAYGGETGVAVRPGEVGTLTALAMQQQPGSSNVPVVRVGKGAVWPTTVYVEAGTLSSNATNTLSNLKITGKATVTTEADSTGALTNVDVAEGGLLIHKGTGAITAATVRAGATLDFSRDARARNLDAVYAYKGATINLDNGNPNIAHSAGGTNVPIIYCLDGVGTVVILAAVGQSLSIR